MYRLEFEDTEDGRKRYEICTQSLILSGMATGSKQVAVSEWDEVIDLLKALKAAGTKTKQSINGKFLYDLNDGGAVVFLEKAEHKLLIDFIKQPMWQPEGLEAAKATVKWLEELQYERGKKNPFESADSRRQKAQEAEIAGHIEGGETVEQLEARLKALKEQTASA